jgi:hypothetical protein
LTLQETDRQPFKGACLRTDEDRGAADENGAPGRSEGGEHVKLMKTRATRILYSAGALTLLTILVEAGKKVPGGGH